MNAILSPADRDRLVAILGMLGSAFDGERASAALLASRMLKAAGSGLGRCCGAFRKQNRVRSGRALTAATHS